MVRYSTTIFNMKNVTGLLFFTLFAISTRAQFAPQAGLAGTTAIHKDSSIFVAWAKACVLNRGWQNIADTTLGKAQVGDETYVPGIAGNGIVSLGDGGSVIVTFAHPISNGAGADFAIFENGFIDQTLKPGTAFLELAFVEVSSDGNNFFRFPAISNVDTANQVATFDGIDASLINNLAGKYIGNYGTPFDLDEMSGINGLDIQKITHVKIIDVVGALNNAFANRDSRGVLINDPWPTAFAQSGFDLDAVGVIHQNMLIGLVENNHHNYLIAYPNPVNARNSFRLTNPFSMQVILTVFDMAGKQVLQQNISQHTTEEIMLEKAGVYYARLLGEESTQTIKIIVQ